MDDNSKVAAEDRAALERREAADRRKTEEQLREWRWNQPVKPISR